MSGMTDTTDRRSREDKLVEAVEALRGRPFDWKTFNCGLAAAEIARAYCGKDHAEKFRPLCEGRLSAMRIVRKAGGLANIMEDLGFEEIPVNFARRGDCVLSKGKGRAREALGIVCSGRRAVFPTKYGLGYIDALQCAKGWRVK